MKNLLIIILPILFLSSCVSEWDRFLEEKNIKISYKEKDDNAKVKIVEYKKSLTINIDYKTPKDFIFPKDSITNLPLNKTQFFLKLSINGKAIEIDTNTYNSNGYKRNLLDTSILIIKFKKDLAKNQYTDVIDIPLFYFHKLKSGKHIINAELYADTLFREVYDSIRNFSYIEKQNILFNKTNFSFELNIPEIHFSKLYFLGLELRNDDEFSPVGMDFSFRLGYPDIYLELFLPFSKKQNDYIYYWKSREATYSTGYHYHDTVYLYHYNEDEKIKINVFDRDDLSKDDFLGSWEGNIEELKVDSNKTLRFNYIDWFKLKIESKGVIN